MNVLESNHHLQYSANAPGTNPHHIRLPSIKEVSYVYMYYLHAPC